jgi:F-type H+-transporting ATPase subunit b
VAEAANSGEQAAIAGTTAGGTVEHYVDPTAFGLNATAFVSIAMLAVIAIMLWKKVPAAIGRALDKKIAGIRDQLDEATRLRAEAEALKAEYEIKAAAAEGEAVQTRERAHAEARAIVAKARTDAEMLVERRTRMAEDKIAAAERTAIADIRATAANAAASAAASLIAERHDADADRVMTDRAIAGLGRPN